MRISLETLVGISIFGFFATLNVIPKFRESFLKANLFGIDLNKRNSSSKIPEATGVITGCVFLIITVLAIPFAFSQFLIRERNDVVDSFPHEEFVQLLAALLSISSMLLLGFADDVLDLQWRHKLALPTVASLPLLMVYYVTSNRTDIVVPLIFRPILGIHIDLGVLYYLYMGLLAVFCTNAINILSGINGLEVGQSIVIATSVAVFNFMELNGPLGSCHHFSLYFLIPFIATSLALFYYNWYPASVFCGDTFCYFSGMTLAVVAILGHFSKTLLLFFVPQIANFLYSIPQLFHFIPCPRHRLPKYDPQIDAVTCSKVYFYEDELKPVASKIFWILETFKSIHVVRREEIEQQDSTRRERRRVRIECNNLTLLNFLLRILGPIHERTLTIIILGIQVTFSILAFFVRYPLALLFYGEVIA